MNQMIEILQEDRDILVCRKPAGIPVQTAKLGQQDMVSLLKNYRAGNREVPEIYTVHRLDQPVEGVMVFAKTQQAAASLSKQIQQKTMDKYYYAIVEGTPGSPEGKLEDYLLRDGKTNTSRVVSPGTQGAKKAVLSYRVLQMKKGSDRKHGERKEELAHEVQKAEAAGGYQSLLEIHLETGRHHQIRAQLAHAGYPLTGDKKYNPACQSGYLPIGLCSVRLAFCHPATGRKLEYAIEPKGEAFRHFYESP